MIVKRQALNNQEQTDNQIERISEALKLIFAAQTKKISFQKIYQSVYKLCRQGLHQEIADLAVKKVAFHFKDIMSHLQVKEGKAGEAIETTIQSFLQITKRVLEIFLYLEANHRQRQGAVSLRVIFNNVIYDCLTKREDLLEKFVIEIAELKIGGDIEGAKRRINLISSIDEDQRFISGTFLPVYIPRMRDFFYKVSNAKISSIKLNEYLEWGIEMIKNEKQFMNCVVSRSKIQGKQEFDSVIYQVYDILVSKQKQKIYQLDPKRLFAEDTPLILEIFDMVIGSDVKQHTDWYIAVVKSELCSLNRTHNQQFLENFIRFYERVTEYLSKTTKAFSISYKVKFIFEEWINEERINIPYRLNLYINNNLTQQQDNKENANFATNMLKFPTKNQSRHQNQRFINNCQVLFKLLKKKDQFQKCYRKMIVKRKIQNHNNQDLEDKLISIMGLECGQQWIHKVQTLRNSIKQHNSNQNLKKVKGKMDAIVFEQSAWPYERENFNSIMAKQLCQMAADFEKKFCMLDPKKKIKFHPSLGRAIVGIKFLNGHSRDFILDTCQTNMILYLKKNGGKFKIQDFAKQHYFTTEQIKDPFKKLLKNCLLVCDDKNFLSLNENFSKDYGKIGSSLLIDMTEDQNEDSIESVQMQQLKADRKLMVEAMIIKIMKAAKTSGRDDIMKKIVPVIQLRGFKFNKEFVNQSIDRLLEKEYLRDFNDGTLGYIA